MKVETDAVLVIFRRCAGIRFPIGHYLLVVHLSLTVSEIFNVECDPMVQVTLNDL